MGGDLNKTGCCACSIDLYRHLSPKHNVVILCDVQIALCQTLALLLLKMEWWTKGVIDDLGPAPPFLVVWSATTEPLHCLRQSTSAMKLFV